MRLIHLKISGCCFHPPSTPLGAEGEGSGQHTSAAIFEESGCCGEVRLRQQHRGARPNGGKVRGLPWWQALDLVDVELVEQMNEPIFYRIGQRSNQKQLAFIRGWKEGNECSKCSVFPLRKRGFNPAARIVHDPHTTLQFVGQAFRSSREIQLDHFTWARAHEEQRSNFGPALQQLFGDAIKLLLRIGEAGQIPLIQDCSAKARFGENHHAGSTLDQVGTGA